MVKPGKKERAAKRKLAAMEDEDIGVTDAGKSLAAAAAGLSLKDVQDFAAERAGPIATNQALAALKTVDAAERTVLVAASVANLEKKVNTTDKLSKDAYSLAYMADEANADIDGYTNTLRTMIDKLRTDLDNDISTSKETRDALNKTRGELKEFKQEILGKLKEFKDEIHAELEEFKEEVREELRVQHQSLGDIQVVTRETCAATGVDYATAIAARRASRR